MRLELDGVSVSLDGRALVDALDLDVRSGEVVGLIGPNGSGKSTALRCLYRALRPSHGAVRLDGTDLSTLSVRASARHLAALTQDSGSDLDLSVAEVVALGRVPHGGGGPLTDREHDLCRAAMERLGVAHLAGRGILGLSGGERQRVLFARALVQEPRVLVLDEPTNHLDLGHQVRTLSMVRSLGVTVLVVLHDLNLAAAACHRLAVLSDGRLVAAGTPREVLTPDLLARVFDVEAHVVDHPLTGDPQVLFQLAPDPAPTLEDHRP